MIQIPIIQIKEEFKDYETRPKIDAPQAVYNLLKHLMPEFQEAFYLLSLNTKNGVLAIRLISQGSLNANVVHPREVFKAAILDSAAHIIVTHNHPSGDPTPSSEDIEITKKLQETGKILGIDLLDHVIIGDSQHFSLKEAGHI